MPDCDHLCAQISIGFYGSAVELRSGPSAEDCESQPATVRH